MFLSQVASHQLEDQLWSHDVEEQKRNRIRDEEAEAGLDPRGLDDPYAPYRIPNDDLEPSPWGNGYQEAFNNSNQALPLVSVPEIRVSSKRDVRRLQGEQVCSERGL